MIQKEKLCFLFSYIFMAVSTIIVFHYHLLGGFIAGCLVYSLTHMISNKMENKFQLGKISRAVFVLFVALLISGFCTAIVFLLFNFSKGGVNGEGITMVLEKIIEVIEGVKDQIPTNLSGYIPETTEVLKQQLLVHIQQNKEALSNIGFGVFHNFIRFILGLVIGSMLAFAIFKKPEEYAILPKHILNRLVNFKDSFDKVVFAQVKISLINTIFTAIYLMIVLPIFDVHLPLTKTMILITFLAGLIPVIGNIISNTVMVIVSLGTSVFVAIISLSFLIIIHKLEYFLNAKIIGNKIQATYWELVIAIVVMEVIFGLAGAIAAPILYAYIKTELKQNELL